MYPRAHACTEAGPLPFGKDRALSKPYSDTRQGPHLATAIFGSHSIKSNSMCLVSTHPAASSQKPLERTSLPLRELAPAERLRVQKACLHLLLLEPRESPGRRKVLSSSRLRKKNQNSEREDEASLPEGIQTVSHGAGSPAQTWLQTLD